MSPSYQRKLKRGNRWYYEGQYLGTRYHSKCIYLTKAQADKAERAKKGEIEERARNPRKEMTLQELMEKRLEYLKAKKSGKYYRENLKCLNLALKAWGNVRVNEVNKAMVSEFILAEAKRLNGKGRQNYSVNAFLRFLKALFYFGNDVYDQDVKNPCTISFYPIHEKLKDMPDDHQIEEVKELSAPDERLLIDFVAETGCRINEALRLKWEDVDEHLVTLWTRKSKNSNLSLRRIPTPPCLKGLQGQGKVFRWTATPRFLEQHVRVLGMSWGWHSLRHRRASLWAQEGKSLLEIMVRLGHVNATTTQRYLHLLGFTYS